MRIQVTYPANFCLLLARYVPNVAKEECIEV